MIASVILFLSGVIVLKRYADEGYRSFRIVLLLSFKPYLETMLTPAA